MSNNVSSVWAGNVLMSEKQNSSKEKNALDLFMKPHNYRYVSLEKLLRCEGRKDW